MQTTDATRAHALERALGLAGLDCAVDWVEETSSTNADLLQYARRADDMARPRLRVAGHQSAGRGRQGRAWLDDRSSLLVSLAWPFPPATGIAGLSLAAGVWLAQALHELGAHDVRLKWPNDVLLHGGKLAGILVELADSAHARWAVIGIGLNLRRPDGTPGASGLDDCGVDASRWDVLARLAPTMLAALPVYAQAGFVPWQDAWNARHAWAGAAVRVVDANTTRERGVALGADADGCLVLDTPDGRRRVLSGDVSLRTMQDNPVR